MSIKFNFDKMCWGLGATFWPGHKCEDCEPVFETYWVLHIHLGPFGLELSSKKWSET